MMRPTPWARMTEPSLTGGTYDLTSLSQPRIAGVEGEVFDLDDKLARSGGRDLGIDVFPGGSVGKSCRAGGEAYLAVGHLSPSAKRIELEAGFNIGDGSRTGKSWMNRLTTMYVRSMSNVVEDAPGWFTRALAAPVETGVGGGRGCSVHFRAWGAGGAGNRADSRRRRPQSLVGSHCAAVRRGGAASSLST